MWPYYGRKQQIVRNYPKPIYDTIIEPFAGAAAYSYRYWEHDVVLYDKYEIMCKIWWYLQRASTQDIDSLPVFEDKQKLEDFESYNSLIDEEKWLVGFCSSGAGSRPSKTAGSMNFNYWRRDKIRIAKDLYKIKHWKIINADYHEAENRKATWFIDPPYQFGGHIYKHSNKDIDYDELANWSESREGQVIVCENSKADWMNFKFLCVTDGLKHKTNEVIWYKEE